MAANTVFRILKPSRIQPVLRRSVSISSTLNIKQQEYKDIFTKQQLYIFGWFPYSIDWVLQTAIFGII